MKEGDEKIFEPYVDVNYNFIKENKDKKAIKLARDMMENIIRENKELMDDKKTERDKKYAINPLKYTYGNLETKQAYKKSKYSRPSNFSDQQVKDFWDKKGEGYFTRGFYNIDPQLRSIYPKSYKEFEELTKPKLMLSDKKIKQLVDKNKMEEKN